MSDPSKPYDGWTDPEPVPITKHWKKSKTIIFGFIVKALSFAAFMAYENLIVLQKVFEDPRHYFIAIIVISFAYDFFRSITKHQLTLRGDVDA